MIPQKNFFLFERRNTFHELVLFIFCPFCLCFSCIKSLPWRRRAGLCLTQLYAGWPSRTSCSYNREKDQDWTFLKQMVAFFPRNVEFSAFVLMLFHHIVAQIKVNYIKSHILSMSSLFFHISFPCLNFLC